MGGHAQGSQGQGVKRYVLVGVNEAGRKVGQYHHRTKVPDETIQRIRELREDEGYSYGRIALLLHLPKRYIAKVCTYQIRGQVPIDFVRIEVPHGQDQH